ncbi:adenylosuccinate lyase [Candidatus Bathyarchaeota archaeon]|nr:MAG: adenylosuccinate lyase [Candidatus Bathyarchaeota archaeon]
MSLFDSFSPTDYRYNVKALKPYLSEKAFIKYKARVESSLVRVLAERGFCSQEVAREVELASREIDVDEVYREEERIKHDIRALVNILRNKVSDEAKPFIHAMATSYDIVDTANALRYRDAVREVLLKDMLTLEKLWIDLARREKNTIQIGRTHGQHAEPITFGFTIAQYINRWGNRILKVKAAIDNLVGKFSGAVGAYNAASLFFEDPESLEREILGYLNLKPAELSTQIVPPETFTDFLHSIVSSFGVLANYARDMRNLQRSEIGEVGEPYDKAQVGSSTMPQKRNPITFENVESAWKKFMPQMITMYLDQISEHQRDLTNSLTQRYIPELLVIFTSSIRKMIRITKKLRVDKVNLHRNFQMNSDMLIAEPLYILLAFYGHPNAHEYVRKLTEQSYRTKKPLYDLIQNDNALQLYLTRFTSVQKEILSNPSNYVGIASKKTEKIATLWENRLLTINLI